MEITPLVATLYANRGATAFQLDPGAAHVWRFPCVQLPEAERSWARSIVAPDELRRSRSFVQRHHQEAFLTQRLFVRLLLGEYVGASPAALRFGVGPRGKPHLVEGSDLKFNLSHADDQALLAIARGFSVGVDLERLAAELEPTELRRTVFAAAEAPLLDGLEGLEQKRAFLRVWCRKEASLKACGAGLLDDLTSLSVVSDRVDLRACRDPRLEEGRAPVVYLQDLTVSDAHVAALATTQACLPVLPIALRDWPVVRTGSRRK